MTRPRPATLQLLSAVLSEYEENFKLNHVTISLPSDHHHLRTNLGLLGDMVHNLLLLVEGTAATRTRGS